MFISLEGIEGAGKSSLLFALRDAFQAKGHEVLVTREPGGSDLGKKLRSIILHTEEKICSEAELFLFMADRAQHLHDSIHPALKRGAVVLCDRYADSTIAYQSFGRGLDINSLEYLHKVATKDFWPDITFLLDVDVETGLLRARTRNEISSLTQSEGRFEAEQYEFHAKVRAGFLAQAKKFPQRFILLDAGQSQSDVIEKALLALKARKLL